MTSELGKKRKGSAVSSTMLPATNCSVLSNLRCPVAVESTACIVEGLQPRSSAPKDVASKEECLLLTQLLLYCDIPVGRTDTNFQERTLQ